jgi:hypothetical protein
MRFLFQTHATSYSFCSADLCYLDDRVRGHEVDAWADSLQSVPDVARFLLPLELLKVCYYYP